jgi:hypothetical protein
VDKFQFMAIQSQVGLQSNINGILGLGPNKNAGPSYIWKLKEQGII